MGEVMTRDDLIAKLRELNPSAKPMDLSMYADLFLEHQLAQRNITEHGPIVFHPRTGAPIDNPYISIRDKAAKRLRDMRIKAGDLW